MGKIEKGIESNMVYLQIKELMENARKQVSVKINNILVQTYWKIGKIIIEDEQENNERAEYGKKLLKELSKKLTKEYGKGFSRSNLQNMRQFYLKYPICQTLSGKLSWSHYCEILSISDDKERAFYEENGIQSEYALGGLSNQIFASKYTLYIPNKEVLENEVEKVLREYDKKIKLKGIENDNYE